MTGELRAQRREPCARCEFECQWVEDGEECPAPDEHCTGVAGDRMGDEAPCPGCNGDGTRWVTVGTLASAAFYHGTPRSLYVIEEASDG